ncbi:MAG: hypothetical protein IID44_10340 [Planctomycetes bacterium]|nr:hypothetical protein [Planctomycetota bacterium]
MSEAFIVTHDCPMPCLEVVFAKCKATERVFAVCTSCGCAWFEPQHETWAPGNLGNCVIDPKEYAPKGFVVASHSEIRKAGFESLIIEVQDGEKWAEDFDWYSNKFCVSPA